MDRIESHTGGIFQTNAYAVPCPSGKWLLIDAPEGVVDWARGRGWDVAGLLLTHAHLDHIEEAAAVRRAFDCPVYYHRDGERFLQDRDAFRRYGLDVDLEPVTDGVLIDEADNVKIGGLNWRILLVPGHCPGSLCFFREEDRVVYAGDTHLRGIDRADRSSLRRSRTAPARHPRKTLPARRRRARDAGTRTRHDDRGGANVESVSALTRNVIALGSYALCGNATPMITARCSLSND